MKLALTLSVLIHFLIFIYWRKAPPPSSPAAHKVEFEIQESAHKPRTKGRTHSHGLGRAKSLGAQFGATTLNTALNGGVPGSGTLLTDDGGTGFNEEDWGSHGARLGEIEYFSSFEKLFRHLQGMVHYPGDLADRGVSDTVNVRLAFGENSQCNWMRSHLGGHDQNFRELIRDLLHRLCSMDLVQSLGFSPGQFVDLSFAFTIVPFNNAQEPPLPDTIQGNVLMFHRQHARYHVEQLPQGIMIDLIKLPLDLLGRH